MAVVNSPTAAALRVFSGGAGQRIRPEGTWGCSIGRSMQQASALLPRVVLAANSSSCSACGGDVWRYTCDVGTLLDVLLCASMVDCARAARKEGLQDVSGTALEGADGQLCCNATRAPASNCATTQLWHQTVSNCSASSLVC